MTLHARWPPLPLDEWQESYETLHLWSQIVGKVRLERMPWINHSWHVPFYVTVNGLSTSLIPDRHRAFEIVFDLTDHRLRLASSTGDRRSFALAPMSVGAFYRKLTRALDELGIDAPIWPVPVEIPGEVLPFPDDERHAAYDRDAAGRLWQILLQSHRVMTEFRAGFVGKVSPVHFFWGAFDLAVTRFSGRTAPPHPGGAPNMADWIMREAYSHEVSSAGFWPGAGLGEPAFYSYAYPEPAGFRDAAVRPDAAYYHEELGEFLLPYEAVRIADDPDATLMAFLQDSYVAAAELANWDRAALEAELPPPDAGPHRRRRAHGRS